MNATKYLIIALTLLSILFISCQSTTQTIIPPTISNITELALSNQDISQLDLVTNQTDCEYTFQEETEYSPRGQYAMCTFYANNLSGSQIIVELFKFADYGNLNGSYQYNSGHLQGAKGIISLNTYGDQSRYSRNSDDDYGAEFNTDNTTYYHLWFTKDLFMVHVTSKGVPEDSVYVEGIANRILSKLE